MSNKKKLLHSIVELYYVSVGLMEENTTPDNRAATKIQSYYRMCVLHRKYIRN